MTDPQQVHISGGKGVVVGDYATVFQNFTDSTQPLTAFLRTAQFRSLIDERARSFLGRDFVFAEIDRLIQSPEFPSGYIVIRGEPGIGKTAISAMLTLRGSYIHHFNIAPENIRSPRQFLENVCAQLILRYELNFVTLPPDAGSDGGFISSLLAEAADLARNRGEPPVVVIVDALDEAEDAGLSQSANRLYLPRTLPDRVFFIVTTREQSDYRLDVDRLREIWIRDDDPANEADVRRYVRSFVERDEIRMNERVRTLGFDQETFIDEITWRSEGNFMYLVHVLSDIQNGRFTRDSLGEIEGLPTGLSGYYKRHWREMKTTDAELFARIQRPVLCFLATSREPVTLMQLVDWSQVELGDVNRVIAEWREFLNEDSDVHPSLYRVYHRSFAEFLDDEENLKWYHGEIAKKALAKIPGFLDG